MINTQNTIVRPGNTHLKPIVGSLLAKTRKLGNNLAVYYLEAITKTHKYCSFLITYITK